MRFIPTTAHAVLDYLVGILLVAAPWLLGFAEGGAETWLPVILGAATVVYSLFTDYRLSVSKSLSMPTHLGLDFAGGAVLAVSPWVFGFADLVFWPHLLIGLFEIAASLTTETVPAYRKGEPR